MNNWFPVISLLILIPTYIPTIFIPYWTRRTESFGVTIPEKEYHNEQLKLLRKQYLRATGLLALIITALFLILASGASESVAANLLTINIFAYLIVSFMIYLFFHKRMKKIKAANNWKKEDVQQIVVSTSFRREKLTHSSLWFLISFFLTIGVVIFTLTNYHLLPEQIPMQYNFSGKVTNWADKSYRSALMLPVMMLFLTLVFLLTNTIIQKAKQQIDQANPAESMKRNALFRRHWSLFIIITGNGVVGLLAFIQLSFFYTISPLAMMLVSLGFTFGILGYAIYLSVKTGQGGSRIKVRTNGSSDTIDRDDDRHWKLGVFYFNPEDPALFLEKRFGIGWTINNARPLVWLILILIIGLAILIPFLLS